MPRQITAFSNPLVKEARLLRDKRHRREAGRFLVEGLRICTEALDAGQVPETLFFARGRDEHRLLDRLVSATETTGGDAIETSTDILSKLTGKDNPGAVAAVYRELPTDLARLNLATAGIWLAAERLRDPGNLGTILRTGDAVGAGGLVLVDDCVDPFSVEAVRASMGAVFTVPIAIARWEAFLGWARTGGGQLVALSLDTDTDYRAARYAAPTVLLTGNEAQGLPADYAAACDLRVKMPMRGRADSLNAAVATAVMAYQVLASQGG